MTIRSLRPIARADNARNQTRASQSLARKLYLLFVIAGISWIVYMIFGPMIFMDADGMVVQSRASVTPPYSAHIISIDVRPGDRVRAGERIAVVISQQMLDLISDLSTRIAQFDSRAQQIQSRAAAIEATLPSAEQRVKEAEFAGRQIARASHDGYMTTAQVMATMRERFEAQDELSSLTSELQGLRSEQATLTQNRARLAENLREAESAYNHGVIVSPVDGTIGPNVANPGAVLAGGERLADVLYGTEYVLGYLPTNRFYGAKPRQKVMITDGVTRQTGYIESMSGIADQLPPEFQSSFRSVERQQIIRVSLSHKPAFPLLSKVGITSPMSPVNLLIAARASLANAASAAADALVANARRTFAFGGPLEAAPAREAENSAR